MRTKEKTHHIIIRVLVNEAIVFEVVLCSIQCIFLLYSFFIERMEDKTKPLFTHGAPPVSEGVGGLYSQYQ